MNKSVIYVLIAAVVAFLIFKMFKKKRNETDIERPHEKINQQEDQNTQNNLPISMDLPEGARVVQLANDPNIKKVANGSAVATADNVIGLGSMGNNSGL